jgi:hypothetical protein
MDRYYFITIKNDSSNNIYFQISNNYPDTAVLLTTSYLNIIHNNTNKTLGIPRRWEDAFSEVFPKDTLLIFFFDSYTINSYDWETIRLDYKILERRAYSKSDLKKSNWTITFP